MKHIPFHESGNLSALARLSFAALICAAFGALPSPALGETPNAPVPENYHARFDAALRSELTGTGASAVRSTLTSPERDAALALAERVPGLRISRDEDSLLPVSVLSHSPGQMLARSSGLAGTTPEAEARGFLAAQKALFGVSDEDLGTLVVAYVSSPKGGATIVKFEQFLGGVQLFDTELSVVMNHTLDVAGVAGRLVPQVGAARAALSAFRLSAAQAIVRAVADLTGRELAASDLVVLDPERAGYSYFELSSDLATDAARAAGVPAEDRFLGQATRVRPVLYPLAAGELIAGYYLELWVDGSPSGSGPTFSYVISAEDGRMLFRNNLTQSDTYSYRTYAQNSDDFRPWDGPTGPIGTPHPTGVLPSGYQAPFLTPAPLIAIESLLGPTDPWLPPAATVTTGNNTDAYLDLVAPNGFTPASIDIRGNGVAGVFDAQYDSTQNVNTAVNRQAAVIGMFYQVNWQHDYWYQRGFDELARNAQTDNYGRGGAANDSVMSEGQDFSGTDNANMSTPADGSRPRMQMFIFAAGGQLNPTREGTFDMLIVGHEIMHYMSNRLVGNASGLSNRQGGSMGEGWADFNAVLMTTEDADNVQDTTYAVGGQTDLKWCGAGFLENYYFSIRRYPYSSSKLKNPLTFKDIGPGITTYPGVTGTPCFSLTSNPSEVHNAGEIWAEMLWEGFTNLARIHGVATARDRMTRYMIDGMKATPNSPTFTQARDGILASANAVSAADGAYLLSAFAKRGIGTGAISPPSGSTTHAGITESFLPPWLLFQGDFETNDLLQWSSSVP